MKVGDLVTAYNSLQGLVLELLEDDYWGKTAVVHIFNPKTTWSRIVELEYKDLEVISESR